MCVYVYVRVCVCCATHTPSTVQSTRTPSTTNYSWSSLSPSSSLLDLDLFSRPVATLTSNRRTGELTTTVLNFAFISVAGAAAASFLLLHLTSDANLLVVD